MTYSVIFSIGTNFCSLKFHQIIKYFLYTPMVYVHLHVTLFIYRVLHYLYACSGNLFWKHFRRNFFTELCSFRGVGCIFAEMVSGVPLFPGVKSGMDQLKKIFKVLYQLVMYLCIWVCVYIYIYYLTQRKKNNNIFGKIYRHFAFISLYISFCHFAAVLSKKVYQSTYMIILNNVYLDIPSLLLLVKYVFIILYIRHRFVVPQVKKTGHITVIVHIEEVGGLGILYGWCNKV